jgi:hypothetical protein
MNRYIFCFFLIALLIAGCNLSSEPEDRLDFNPIFEANIGGEYNLYIAGRANYAYFTDPGTDRQGAAIQLITTEPSVGAGRGISFTGRVSSFEEDREYQIVRYGTGSEFGDLDPNTFFVIYVHGDQQPDYSTFFNGRSGTLSVREIEGNRLSGTFAFTATGIHTASQDTVEIMVSGEFDALQGELDL